MRMSPSKQLCNVWHERTMTKKQIIQLWYLGCAGVEFTSSQIGLKIKWYSYNQTGLFQSSIERARCRWKIEKILYHSNIRWLGQCCIIFFRYRLIKCTAEKFPFLWWFNEEIHRKLYDGFISTVTCIDISIVYFHMNQFINFYSYIERSTTAACWIKVLSSFKTIGRS